jgi:hypothetical protein
VSDGTRTRDRLDHNPELASPNILPGSHEDPARAFLTRAAHSTENRRSFSLALERPAPQVRDKRVVEASLRSGRVARQKRACVAQRA